MNHKTYLDFLRFAKRQTRRMDEAEDLLQTALLAAIEAGRADLSLQKNRQWLLGTISKRAAFDARTAMRRRKRENCMETVTLPSDSPIPLNAFLDTLPPSLRSTALLALTGHTRIEIAYLLRLSNTALRQRIRQIRTRWQAIDGPDAGLSHGPLGTLPYGLIRRALHGPVLHLQANLASHDPDGNLFCLKILTNRRVAATDKARNTKGEKCVQ